jgi:hypothetical protein
MMTGLVMYQIDYVSERYMTKLVEIPKIEGDWDGLLPS